MIVSAIALVKSGYKWNVKFPYSNDDDDDDDERKRFLKRWSRSWFDVDDWCCCCDDDVSNDGHGYDFGIFE